MTQQGVEPKDRNLIKNIFTGCLETYLESGLFLDAFTAIQLNSSWPVLSVFWEFEHKVFFEILFEFSL